MAEVYRVAADGADVFIVTPHFSSHNSYTDPTHKRHLAAASFDYFTGKRLSPASPARLTASTSSSVTLTFGGNLVLDNLGRLISARHPMRWYERHAAWIFPALDIRCHLRTRKQPGFKQP
jgi:hypothetical protein